MRGALYTSNTRITNNQAITLRSQPSTCTNSILIKTTNYSSIERRQYLYTHTRINSHRLRVYKSRNRKYRSINENCALFWESMINVGSSKCGRTDRAVAHNQATPDRAHSIREYGQSDARVCTPHVTSSIFYALGPHVHLHGGKFT